MNSIAKYYIVKQRNGFLGLFWSNNPEYEEFKFAFIYNYYTIMISLIRCLGWFPLNFRILFFPKVSINL